MRSLGKQAIGVTLFLLASTGFSQERESDKIAPLKSQTLIPLQARVLKATAREVPQYRDGELVVGVNKIKINVTLAFANRCFRKEAGSTVYSEMDQRKMNNELVAVVSLLQEENDKACPEIGQIEDPYVEEVELGTYFFYPQNLPDYFLIGGKEVEIDEYVD